MNFYGGGGHMRGLMKSRLNFLGLLELLMGPSSSLSQRESLKSSKSPLLGKIGEKLRK